MSDEQPNLLEIYTCHYETLDEEARVAFLLNLKREGKPEFLPLAQRWIRERVKE